MWTPRRVLLLFCGVIISVGAYTLYARLLGWLDGLPQLPTKMLRAAAHGFRPPDRPISPTELRLIEAFGPDCPERGGFYPTKLEFRNGESSVVLASGTSTPDEKNRKKVILAPFSLAVFGKPRPVHLRKPGEVVEISTFHADRAVLEFDREITGPGDMSKAKLLRLDLVSEPDPSLTPPDPRVGMVHITNNQRSADPNEALVLRTAGPVFYREAKHAPGASGPDVWTDAAVEVTDRRNLPRVPGGRGSAVAPASGEDLRSGEAVPEILTGRRMPPPTITAVGMRVYLEPESKPGTPAPPKKGSAGFSGVRRIELQEKVLINLWVDATQGFVGTPSKLPDQPPADPPAALAALTGGLSANARDLPRLDRALVQIETLGPFAYDVEKNLARFDVVPQANPNLPNDVQVTRIPPRGGQHKLFSQVLEIEFNGPPTGPQPSAPPPGTPSPKAAADAGGPAFKRIHAWTFTPGRYLTVSAEPDQLEAYGTDLVHDQATSRTTLQGAPLYAVRDRNVLTAGSAGQPATLILEPGPEKTTTATVLGPGRIELFDPAANGNTIHASWRGSLVHAREFVNRRELDVLTFTDAAAFEDKGADYWLRAKVLKLWVGSAKAVGPDRKPGDPAPPPLPHRLQALGEVTGHSADFDVEQADQLNVMFREATPPPPRVGPAVPAAPGPPGPMGPMGPMPPAAPAPKAPPPTREQPKTKPPTKLKARVIDTIVARYPVATPAAKPAADKPRPAAGPNEGSVRYELEKARCEGRVSVHQDPDDPKNARGLDVFGSVLVIDHTPDGSVMTVTGTDDRPGEVHYEGMSILGPKVVIDQLHNLAQVEGRGALQMPAGSDLAGGELKQPEVLIVHWRDKMEFSGAKRKADFHGKVSARQGESWVLCHTMYVTLDRPVYFNQMRKPAAAPPPPPGPAAPPKADGKDSPKVETVHCYPAPEDAKDELPGANRVTFHQVERDPAGRVVKTQQLTAGELELVANAQDDPRGEKYQKVDALGPGTLRVWQRGEKDTAGPAPTPAAPAGAPRPKEPETEMKLTVVNFAGKMTVKDKGKVYQEAVFFKDVQVIQVPTDDPTTNVERHRLPPRSVLLTCADRLMVSSHKQGNGPPAQTMRADGNAFIRSDEYDGWGEVVTFDGRYVVLESGRATLAQIKSRYKGNDNSGKRIVYDRTTGDYKVDGSAGGTIDGAPKK